jgi:hypothetical protein
MSFSHDSLSSSSLDKPINIAGIGRRRAFDRRNPSGRQTTVQKSATGLRYDSAVCGMKILSRAITRRPSYESRRGVVKALF